MRACIVSTIGEFSRMALANRFWWVNSLSGALLCIAASAPIHR